MIHEDLLKERSRATFCSERLTNFLDGGEERTGRRRQIEAIVRNDPTGIFDNSNNAYLHRRERHVRSLAKAVRMVELGRMLGIFDTGNDCLFLHQKDFPLLLSAIADDLPLALHWIMFVPNILSLCDDEQIQQWIALCTDWKMIGCYAQTELGHGSNVRALETTATFQKDSVEHPGGGSWIINTPTLTATKFWPGTLGRTANHAMVIAQLIDGEGKNRGIHNFLVPLRSMNDHKLLKGVTTGDIGPKLGYNNMDNGFASFDNVVIPRRNMAMRFATVDENGKYTSKVDSSGPASKIAYISMMQVRSLIINEAGKHLAMACTIAIRYSAVRRQGFDQSRDGEKTGAEMQILDYTQQQHRLLPLLAASYCFFFTGKKIMKQLQVFERNILEEGSAAVTKEQVADLHASTSCLKSFCTTVAADGIEDCRKSCGGHGYLQASGLPEMIQSYLQNPTVEGDNHMLPQQTARSLLKIVKAVKLAVSKNNLDVLAKTYKGCDSAYLVNQLHNILLRDSNSGDPSRTKCSASTKVEMMDFNNLLNAFQHRSARLLLNLSERIHEQMSSGSSTMQQCWNEALVEMYHVSKAHSLAVLLKDASVSLLAEEEEEASSGAQTSCLCKEEISVLKELVRLFALYWIEKDIGDFLEDGYMNRNQSKLVRSCVLDLLKCIRPQAVALVDARDFSDFRLKSALGRFDGNVYPAIMQSALKDSLNATEPGPGHEHLLKLVSEGVGVCGTASRL